MSGLISEDRKSIPDAMPGGEKRKSALHNAIPGQTGKQVPIEHLRDIVDGNKFGFYDFELKPTVGTGAFGRVRVVMIKDNEDKSPFALKMLNKSRILKGDHVDHVKAEAQILMQLSHPFIVNLLAVFHDSRRLCMLMEFVNGGELFGYLSKMEILSTPMTRFYACQIVLTLQYIHRKEIVYRDLKPENLLLDADGNLKLADFGFAMFLEGRTFTLCGTPEYMAPEIIQSKGHGKPVDWWALGVLIFEMLAGFSPFFDEQPFGVYQRVMAARLEFPDNFSADVRDLIRQMLTLDRKKRMGKLDDGDDVKKHTWFDGMNWEHILERRIQPPYKPEVKCVDDTSMFDVYDEEDGENWEVVPEESNAIFEDFSEALKTKPLI